ncbi:3,2-trans-enoyl-CoA isomerase [Nannizzia gypsea CBS 118893]|uniref:3,2-trans-enoyl-CoA isomerase n=1 Tax=Arthroderma gypseum (strain ATCC MYA-4604 / CBS 118893) TaxID=535722 RepID=E5QYR1_ARTGP|nr:3,2-trans-enoyl-CoA isomerase [Nannizzia gypsea CBS 118893]EFQ97249.1 3,2-trans-enoyl-CoA isomerase [Nannizzia gypsea CBS 118893]
MSYPLDEVTVTYQDRVAIITLNRPAKLNALTGVHYYLLGKKMREVAERDDIYITVLTGVGRFFSAGADVLRSVPEKDGNVDGRRDIVEGFVANNIDLTHTFYTHPKILVVALNGPAVGLSAALVAFGDFIYATPHAYILTPFSSIGLVTEGGSSHAFVRRMGLAKAKEALIMSKRISPEELLQAGFVNKIFTPASGKEDDSDAFLKMVLHEIEMTLGTHLNQDSMLKIKALINAPDRDILDRQNVLEVFGGLDRFVSGIPQAEFMKLASGQKKHKL